MDDPNALPPDSVVLSSETNAENGALPAEDLIKASQEGEKIDVPYDDQTKMTVGRKNVKAAVSLIEQSICGHRPNPHLTNPVRELPR